MSAHGRAPRFLSARELAAYRRDGFLVCRNLFDPDKVAELRRATEEVQAWPEQPGTWMVYSEQSLREPGRRLINRIEIAAGPRSESSCAACFWPNIEKTNAPWIAVNMP